MNALKYAALTLAIIYALTLAATPAAAQSVFGFVYVESGAIIQQSDSRVGTESTGPMLAASLKLRVIGSRASEYVCVYGGDAETFAHGSVRYACENLEDAKLWSQANARRIRAVVNASYPYSPLARVIAEANAATRSERFNSLTEGDAIAAAQAAIWSLANAEPDSRRPPYPPFAYVDTKCADGVYRRNAEREVLVNGLRDWLLSLEGEAASVKVTDISAACSPCEKGAGFSMRVVYQSRYPHADGAPVALLASSVDGEISDSRNLGGGRYSLVLTAKSASQSHMTFTVSGTQRTADDVFLYSAEGGRKSSQYFVGKCASGETDVLQSFHLYNPERGFRRRLSGRLSETV